jgi:hypothetical protein
MKTLFIFLSIGLISPAFSQDLRILQGTTDVTGTTVTEKIIPNSEHRTAFSLYNSSNSIKTFTITRILKNKLMPGNEFFFAIHPLHVAPSGDSIYILNHEFSMDPHTYISAINSEGFATYFFTGPVCQENVITYKLGDVNMPGDTSEITIHYSCATGIYEYEAGIVSDVYPNPAATHVTIDYAFTTAAKKAKIEVYDVLGKTVKEIAIESKEGKAILNVDDLKTGLYFYTIITDDKATRARKLIIKEE